MVARIKANAPVLRPDDPVPTNLVRLGTGRKKRPKSQLGRRWLKLQELGHPELASLSRSISTCVTQIIAGSVATAR